MKYAFASQSFIIAFFIIGAQAASLTMSLQSTNNLRTAVVSVY